MEIIMLSGIGAFVLLAAQLLGYLREITGEPVTVRITAVTAEKPLASASPPIEVATLFDRAA